MRLFGHNLPSLRAVAIAATVGVCAALPVLAQTGPDFGLDAAAEIGLTTVDIRTLVARIISYFLGLLGIIAVSLIMYAGFVWMTSQGDPDKVKRAKGIMTSAVIGLIIIVLSFAIVQFIVRAVVGDTGGNGAGGPGGCPPGQTCGLGGGTGGGSVFRVTGIMPSGPGPGDRGWPKNYAITVNFSAPVADTSVTAASFEVRRCNARVNGGGDAQPFDYATCGGVVEGTRTVSGSRIVFRPSETPGDQPTDFEGDFWYSVRVRGGDVRDQIGRTLVCPFLPAGDAGNIGSASAAADLCDRGIAFNMQRDLTPPSVSLDAPRSPPAFCGTLPVPVRATATDDVLAAAIDYLLDGGTANLMNALGELSSSDVNTGFNEPFVSSGVFVDLAGVAEGTHTLSAVSQDGVPQSSETVSRNFTVSPAYCCNAIRDDAEGETGVDCGGACGSCGGDACTDDGDCASGYCDGATGQCAERPVIDAIEPMQGGAGTYVTIRGRFFGRTPGAITFLGADGDTDDARTASCVPEAWSENQIVVQVPSNAVTGSLRVATAAGQYDQTDDERGPNLGAFNVSGATRPGICNIAPNVGAPGAIFSVNGLGFGAAVGSSAVAMGSYAPSVATGGWADNRVSLIVPTAPERVYPVNVTVGGITSNSVDFGVRLDATTGGGSSGPQVISVSPEAGPIGSYVTVIGSGFGRLKGTVRFGSGQEVAIGEDPVCSDNWTDRYVVVKVPSVYESGLDVRFGALPGIAHTVQVTTAPPFRASNEDVTFRITNEPARPGICAITPDNGPPGKTVEISGTGFGTTSSFGPGSSPRYSVEFFSNNNLRCLNNPAVSCATLGAACASPADGVCAPTTVASSAYSVWEQSKVVTTVPGDINTRASWPATGPVYVVTNNNLSANGIPFQVGDCHDSGASCGTGTTCCANGSCQTSCEPVARTSAYGWLFSTDILPSFPTVVENAFCRAQPLPSVLQSPSPYKGNTDACVNAELRVEFSRAMRMDPASLAGSVELTECGTGDAADCSGAPLTGLRMDPRDCATIGSTDCGVITFVPASDYNNGTPYLKEHMWYRVRLVSDPQSGRGLRSAGDDGRWLDGDLDRRGGGDYVYTFRTRDTAQPCEIADVFVDPSRTTIDQDTDPVEFQAVPTAANCNSLRCAANQPYTIDWLTEAVFLQLLPATTQPGNDASFCSRSVLALAETASTPVTAVMTPTGTGLGQSGTADVTVRFAEPRVLSVTPTAACTEACINAAIVATFNVPMDAGSLEQPGNVELFKCRNASCTAPFLPLGATVRTVETQPPADGRHVSITGAGTAANLEPASFYLVRIRGGENGVHSRSGVALGGLNDGEYYTWQFRTKDDPSACLASRSTVSPESSTLFYVGQRQDLSATPFGSPDECSASGQELIPGMFSWNWSVANPNLVIAGFVDGSAATPISMAPLATLVDTNATPRAICSGRCLLRGSQNTVPQCGNGQVERQYEECDGSAGCSTRCVMAGTQAPACGNGVINPGENCESVSGTFPAGCKQPGTHVDGWSDQIGCVLTGASTAPRATCGDGFVGDGEACDDNNRANGDGCSADCLKEGTLPTCLGAAPGTQCINFCGNGRAEPGEDPACEPNPGAHGCNIVTCLKTGTPACASGSGANCCGNGVVDSGEEASCETDSNASAFCTNRCLFRGSSAFYDQPSFCGDNIVGSGEHAACEQAPDGTIDAYQVTTVAPQTGFNSTSASANTSTVIASTEGIAAADAGSAKVTLSCTCNTLPAGDRDAFCGGFAPDLACSTGGCCAPRPRVTDISPDGNSNNACRNSAVTVSFDQVMDSASLQQNVVVGYDNGTAACPAGTSTIAGIDGAGQPRTGFWARIGQAISSFFRRFVLQPVLGAAPGLPNANHVFCAVEATVTVTREGEPTPTASTAHVAVAHALPANTWIMVRVLPGARAATGVAVDPAGERSFFGTSPDICTVSRVEVMPRSTLFSSTEQPPVQLTARAISANAQEIVPTVEYAWTWRWTPQPAAEPNISPIVLTPTLGQDGAHTAVAEARVRGTQAGDVPSGYVPKNGQAIAEAAAVITTGSTTRTVTGEADVTVFLCENPWPTRRVCAANGRFTLPWDTARTDNSCTPETTLWYPFYDPQMNYSFYYCRDGATAGGPPALPGLRETPVIVTPGRDIVREYLFTYDPGFSSTISGSDWQDDAIGFRISTNPEHVSSAQWYTSKGFKGNPEPAIVDGFDAMRDGRTVYVNAAANAGAGLGGNLYTNVGVFSHTDGAVSETVNIFNQIIGNVEFLSTAGFSDGDAGICRSGTGSTALAIRCNVNADCRVDAAGAPAAAQSAFTCDAPRGVCLDAQGQDAPNAGIAVACSADLDCQTDVGGNFLLNPDNTPARAAFTCDAPKAKLTRDTRRWADLQSMRQDMNAVRAAGSLPKLEAGSFLSAMSTSAWPSWDAALAPNVGGSLPSDPVNLHAWCATSGRQEDTCWNSQTQNYLCPAGSHVYGYEYYQDIDGANFRLRADFETVTGSLNATWRGNTCIERTAGTCVTADNLCALEGGICNYRTGKMYVGGVNRGPNCVGTAIGTGGTCGDGTVSPGAGEVCEPGQASTASCPGNPGGLMAQICANDCRSWVARPGATCQLGRCGDGAINGSETCDEGTLNGTYGHCNAACTGVGFRCGDNARQPGEACDCGDRNGQYYFNGRLQPSGATCLETDSGAANANSCAWDCSGAGPRCGDGVVNGGETCDGGVQEARGFCSTAATVNTANPAGTLNPCNTDSQCTGGERCGNFCPTPEQRNRRSCMGNSIGQAGAEDNLACHWNTWVCTAAGYCGNGVTETGEECDDGNTDNADGCVIDPVANVMCKNAVCGDGYARPSVGEQCDNGSQNDQRCTAEYGLSCTFCSSQCRTTTLSGGFCGDGALQSPTSSPPGSEVCDGSVGLTNQYICVSTRPELQSYGLRTGVNNTDQAYAICSAGSCSRTCAQPDSEVCLQDSTANLDGNDNEYWLGRGYDGYGIDRALNDVCDPDWDNDGVPNEYAADCDKRDADTHGAYSMSYVDLDGAQAQISIGEATELCDGADNNCNGIVDDSPPVDMVFVIDASLSMDDVIRNVSDAISNFAAGYACSMHQFAIVIAGMPTGDYSAVNYAGRTYMNFGDAATLTARLDEIALQVETGGTLRDSSGFEITLDAIEGALSSSNPYGLNWRSTVPRKIVVVVTDTYPQSVSCRGTTTNSQPDSAKYCATAADRVRSRINTQTYSCNFGFGCTDLDIWAYVDQTVALSEWDYVMGDSNRTRNAMASASSMTNDMRNNAFAGVCAPPVGSVCPEMPVAPPPTAGSGSDPNCNYDGDCDANEHYDEFGSPGSCNSDCPATTGGGAPAVCGNGFCEDSERPFRSGSDSGERCTTCTEDCLGLFSC